MRSYKPGDDVGPLEDWPFDHPESGYVIRHGTPRASGRIDKGGPGETTRVGIWRCSEGVFECTELGDELQTVLSGRVRLSMEDGTLHELGPGDSILTLTGQRVTWEIVEDVTKVFFGYKDGGF